MNASITTLKSFKTSTTTGLLPNQFNLTTLSTTFGNFWNSTNETLPYTTIPWMVYPPTSPIVVTPTYYYSYSLYGYLIFLLLLCLILIALKLAYHRRQEVARRAAAAARARRRQSPVVVADNNQTNEPPKDDLPPAYDDVVQAKLALQAAAEEGRAAQASGDSNTQSSITLATLVETTGSNANLRAQPRASTATVESNETLPPAYENAVFEHDETNDRRNDNTNSHSQN